MTSSRNVNSTPTSPKREFYHTGCSERTRMSYNSENRTILGDVPGDRIRLGLIALLFLAYPFHFNISEYTVFSVNLSYGDAVVVLLILLWVVGVFGHRELPRYMITILVFVCVVTISFAANTISPEPYFSFSSGVIEIIKFGGGVAWMIAIYAAARGRSSLILPVGATVSVVVAAIAATLATHQMWLGEPRITGPFENPNLFANYLLLNVCFVGYLTNTWIGDRVRWPNMAAILVILTLILGMTASGSRGSFVGLAAIIGFVLLFSPAISLRALAIWTVVPLAIIGIAMTMFADQILSFHFFQRLDRSMDSRFVTWSIAYEAFRANPIFGIGYGQFPNYLPLYREGRSFGVHNTYLSLLAESGIAAPIAFLSFIIWGIKDSVEVAGQSSRSVFLGALVVATTTQGVAADVLNFRSLWIAIGFIAVYYADRPSKMGGYKNK